MNPLDDNPDPMGAVRYFMTQAQAAMVAADAAASPDAIEALYQEAETWICMASRCLDPDAARSTRAAETRSFRREE